jgi:hypothetical protein
VIAIEPHLPPAENASGVAATLYRLNDAVSGVGLAVAASFAAYLLGSLSSTLFSPVLRALFLRPVGLGDGIALVEPLSRSGYVAAHRLANHWSSSLLQIEVCG